MKEVTPEDICIAQFRPAVWYPQSREESRGPFNELLKNPYLALSKLKSLPEPSKFGLYEAVKSVSDSRDAILSLVILTSLSRSGLIEGLHITPAFDTLFSYFHLAGQRLVNLLLPALPECITAEDLRDKTSLSHSLHVGYDRLNQFALRVSPEISLIDTADHVLSQAKKEMYQLKQSADQLTQPVTHNRSTQPPPTPGVMSLEDLFSQDIGRAILNEHFALLPPRYRQAMELRFGLSGGPRKTFREVAVLMGISKARVGQMVDKSLRFLRNHKEIQRANDYGLFSDL